VIEISERDGKTTFALRVAPRASRDVIEGQYQGALKVRLTASPVDDRANDALRRLLAEQLNGSIAAVRIVAGERNRIKRLSIPGVTRAQIVALAESRALRKGADQCSSGSSGDCREVKEAGPRPRKSPKA
jgi:uncharacterized protein YggU (UPF0235/DUF167 family)